MVSNGQINVLYSGCQYEPQEFKDRLDHHQRHLDEFFSMSVEWMGRKGYAEVQAKILSGDFVLFEFDELRSYYPDQVTRRAWAIYRSVCEHQNIDWCVYHPDPETFHVDHDARHNKYHQIIRLLAG